MPTARLRLAALAAATLTIVACDCRGRSTAPGSAGSTATGTAAAAPRPKLDAGALAPVIQPLGEPGGVPDRIAFEFPVGVVDDVGGESSGTVVRLRPEVKGTARFTGTSTLVFTPQQPFEPDREYKVELEAVATRDGVLKPAKAGAWSAAFHTPPLAFLRFAPLAIDLREKRLALELVFSGPVAPDKVRPLAAFTVDGKAVRDVAFSKGVVEQVVVATLEADELRPGAKLRLVLRAGLPSVRGSSRAAAAEASFTIQGGRQLAIRGATVGEGASGHYLEISCEDEETGADASAFEDHTDDEFAQGEELGGEGDSEAGEEGEPEHAYASSRPVNGCTLPDAEALEGIRFDPAVKFYVAPSRGGFRLFGDFKRGSYTVTIQAGVTSAAGGYLYSAFRNTFTIPARSPQIGFASAGRYLPRSALRGVPVTHLNVDAVDVTVRQIPPENVVFWLSSPSSEAADERTSSLVARTTIPVKAAPDTLGTTFVDLGALVPDARGVLEVRVGAAGRSSVARIALTDLSLVAKRSAPPRAGAWSEEVRVWALDGGTAEPVSGVEVSLVQQSGKAVARCTTSDDGCKITVKQPALDASEPFALLARKGDDLTFLRWADLRLDLSESNVQGEPYLGERPYRAAAWADRGVYRPGDTAHLAVLVRGADLAAPAAGLPVTLEVVDPRQRLVKKLVLPTNEAGLVTTDLPFAAFADTGRWDVRLSVAERPVASLDILVEEFVPERMKVTARAERDGFALDARVPFAVEAQYLFGGSAEGSSVELTCRVEPAEFKPRENADYTYAVWRRGEAADRTLTLGQAKGILDRAGRARVECPPLELASSFKGPARVVAQAAVFEAGSGRTTQATGSAAAHPEAFYLGLKAGDGKVHAGKPLQLEGVVVDWHGALVVSRATRVQVEVIRLEEEYGYVFDAETGHERYKRFLRPVREAKQQVEAQGGRFRLALTPEGGGARYLVRATSGRAQTDLELEGDRRFYDWGGYASSVDQTPRPSRPTALPMTVPASVRVGEKASVVVRAPYPGRLLFTVETNRVLESEWVEVEQPGPVTWELRANEFAPNLYVSALLVKDPHVESKEAFLPDRAFAVESVRVEPVALVQPLAITVPKEIRSGAMLDVKLDLGKLEGPTYVTVAAVDEGILSLTRFRSPDPLSELLARRALGVETFETVGWSLLVPPAGPSARTGGDEEASSGPAPRAQPVKPVALWSGVVRVPDSGQATVKLPVPRYRGALRVMAVAAGPKRVGQASAQVRVADPLVIQATFPRFLALGDEVQVPVFVTNLTGAAATVKVSLAAEELGAPGQAGASSPLPPIAMLGRSEGRLTLDAGKAGTLVFQTRAQRAYGAAKLEVVARAGAHESRETLEVPFLPPGPRERLVQRVELQDGDNDLLPRLQGWLPGSETTTVWATGNPYGEAMNHLRFLVQYPHGCIEQTTSSTRPLLYVSSLVDDVDPTLVASGKLDDMVMHGVNRVLSMQTPSGGFGYWPGDPQPNPWGTAYATHMLLDAKKKGYPIPEERLQRVLAWIGEVLTARERGSAEGYGWENAEPYLHYVLALSGKGRTARIQKLIEAMPGAQREEGQEDLYLLQAAMWLSGDRRHESALKAPDASAITGYRANSWSYYSDLRRRGLLLSTFQDLFGSDAAGEPLAQRIAAELRRGSYSYTTQELVWGVTALGKRAGARPARFQATLVAAGKALPPPVSPDKGAPPRTTWSVARASEHGALALRVARSSEGKAYALLSSEGVRRDGDYRTGGDGLRIERVFRRLDGGEVSPAQPITLGDLLFVQLTLRNTTDHRIQNIALVDRLPAGFEIENPRLSRGGTVEWLDRDSVWQNDYLDLRDDRISVYGAIDPGEARTVVYAVRAVSSGTFALPPVEAEAMYDPDVWAREKGGLVRVNGPWKDDLL